MRAGFKAAAHSSTWRNYIVTVHAILIGLLCLNTVEGCPVVSALLSLTMTLFSGSKVSAYARLYGSGYRGMHHMHCATSPTNNR